MGNFDKLHYMIIMNGAVYAERSDLDLLPGQNVYDINVNWVARVNGVQPQNIVLVDIVRAD